MLHLAGLNVLILGLGDSGLAMARWCARCGAASVRVADTRQSPPQAGRLAQDVPGAVLHQGLDPALLDGVNLLLKSPGLSPLDAAVAPLLQRADELGIPVRGELSLFASALTDLKTTRGYAPKVLAITGTNGKTTTTSLTALLVERAGKRVGLAGNIGPTLLDTLATALDQEPQPETDPQEAAGQGAALAAHVAEDAAHIEVPVPAPASSPLDDEEDATDLPVEDWAGDVEDGLSDEEPAGDQPAEDAGLHGQPGSDPAAIKADDAIARREEAPATVAADEPPVSTSAAPAEDSPEPGAPALPLPAPAEPLFVALPEVWVLELSSFQLDGVTNFEPSAAAVLNITQDHLDWHGSLQAYADAKARIYGREAVMVVNRDDPMVEAMIPPPQVVKSAVRGRPARTVHRRVVRFGLDAPRQPGDFGLVVEGGMAWLVRAMESDETIKRKPSRPPSRRDAASAPQGGASSLGRPGGYEAGEEEELILQRLMPADALRIRGRHNAANALAALALATAIGCPLAPMLHGLREYRGEPHRVEPVARIGDVEAYDDSKGTNVGATVAALTGLGADIAPARLVVILGGDGKGQDFSPLLDPVRRHVRAVALIGRDAAAIAQALQPAAEGGLVLQAHDDLPAATRWAFEQARAGDAVLLSPACASLDMFRNYAHRAEVFIDTVRALADERGELA
ncbi:MAG: UDP-N-acetylmuramoyl-L-alanine--D-glutamate ligase [Burkholderiales bacterium]|nr:UDP-N-acetylmuramoyl-L-alanine--D-glutamate ligase [Burkholderiales bacterium]